MAVERRPSLADPIYLSAQDPLEVGLYAPPWAADEPGQPSTYNGFERSQQRFCAIRGGIGSVGLGLWPGLWDEDAGGPWQTAHARRARQAPARADRALWDAVMARCPDRLPERARQLYARHYVEGLSLRAVAARWGVSGNTVRSVLARGRSAVRRLAKDRPVYVRDPPGAPSG